MLRNNADTRLQPLQPLMQNVSKARTNKVSNQPRSRWVGRGAVDERKPAPRDSAHLNVLVFRVAKGNK